MILFELLKWNILITIYCAYILWTIFYFLNLNVPEKQRITAVGKGLDEQNIIKAIKIG